MVWMGVWNIICLSASVLRLTVNITLHLPLALWQQRCAPGPERVQWLKIDGWVVYCIYFILSAPICDRAPDFSHATNCQTPKLLLLLDVTTWGHRSRNSSFIPFCQTLCMSSCTTQKKHCIFMFVDYLCMVYVFKVSLKASIVKFSQPEYSGNN